MSAFEVGDWVRVIKTDTPFDGRTGMVVRNNRKTTKVRLAPVPNGIALEAVEVDGWENLTEADAPEGYCLGCALKHGEKPVSMDYFGDEDEDDER